jgi:hypothetical protein
MNFFNSFEYTRQTINPKAVQSETAYQCGYQQALSDFGIKDLKAKVSEYFNTNGFNQARYVEEQDQESLIAFLIEQLTNNLNSQLIDNYFKALCDETVEVLLSEIQLPTKQLPINFKESATPRYPDGSCLRWIPSNGGVDWGMAIGRFLAYAPHLCRWSWKYIILLEEDSKSAAWVVADTAWEDDLEPLAPEDEQ